MNCDEVQELLSPYADNMLDEDETNLISLHLKTCNVCSEEYERLLGLISALHSMKELELPEGFEARLHERLISEQTSSIQEVSAPKRKRFFIPSWLPLGAVAAALVMLFLGVSPVQLGIDGLYLESVQPGQSYDRSEEESIGSVAEDISHGEGSKDAQLSLSKAKAAGAKTETAGGEELKQSLKKAGADIDTYAGVFGNESFQEPRDSIMSNGFRAESARRGTGVTPFAGAGQEETIMSGQDLFDTYVAETFPFMHIRVKSPDDFLTDLVGITKSLGGEIRPVPMNTSTNTGLSINPQVTHIVSMPCSSLKPFIDNVSDLGIVVNNNLTTGFGGENYCVSAVDYLQNRKSLLTELLMHTSDIERNRQIRQEISAIDSELEKIKSSSIPEPTIIEINIIVEKNGNP